MALSLPLNPALESLPVYKPGRPIEEVARELGLPSAEIIKLASNENPLGPSPVALAAMQRILPQLHLYPDGNAFYLKQKLAEKLGLDPQCLILGNGSNEIIEFVGHALIDSQAHVITSQFCFAIYPIVTKLFGGSLASVPAKRYGHDLPAMLKAVTPQTKVMFVADPNNPTGTRVNPEELRRLIQEIPPHVLLVVDQAYIEYLDDPVDLLPFIRRYEKPNLLLMRTFSKIYGLAGLRLGYGIGHPELISALEKVRQPFNINSLVQAAALAALDDAAHLANTRKNNRAGLEFFQTEFQKLGLEYVPSFANFVLVRVGNGESVFAKLQSAGVIARPMSGYQLPEWLRISVGTSAENARCCATLKKILVS